MFTTSFLLAIGYLLSYMFLPLIPGILSTWLLAGSKFTGKIFYVLSWFIGVGVLSYGLFLLQFIRFGIDWIAYAIIVLFVLILLSIKNYTRGIKWKNLFTCLMYDRHIFASRNKQTTAAKYTSAILLVLIFLFAVSSFLFVTHFPSYGDDAFGNRHLPAINMLYDGGIKIFGPMNEILARGRLGYPIMIASLQAFVSHVMGGYNDIYINILPWLAAMLFFKYTILFVHKKTNSILLALLGPALMISLPLIFLHTTQGYMDFLSAIYASLAIMSFYQWLQEEDNKHHLVVAITLLGILSYIKNDGFIVYMTGIVGALIVFFTCFYRRYKTKLKVFANKSFWISTIGSVLFFIVPFTFLKSYYNLGFNQAAGESSGIGLSSMFHREIFPVIWQTIRSMNNFNIAPLIFFALIIFYIVYYKRKETSKIFLLLAPVVILCIFLLVFLCTENYKFVLDQTTINRVVTMVFVIVFSSIGILLDD